MQKHLRRTLLVLIVALLMPLVALGVGAEQSTEPLPDLSKASAVYFHHLESDRRMGTKNETQKLPAGVTVRMISGLLYCQLLENRLNDVISIREEMLKGCKGYYGYGIAAGDFYTVEQLLYLSVCGGYNDAYYVLAYELGGGSVQSFVDMMNAQVQKWGAVETMTTDPSGLLDSSHTTAEDLFRIARIAMENQLYMKISGSAFYDLTERKRIDNRNALISKAKENGKYYNALCTGLVAGNTDAAGWSVVTLSQDGNDRYLCIVLGGKEGEGEQPEKYGYLIANRLIKWGYRNYRYLEVLNEDTLICSIPVKISDVTDTVQVKPMEALSFYLPSDAEVGEDIQLNIRLMYETLEAPVATGTHVGYVAVIYQGEILGTVAIYTAEDAQRSEFVGGLMRIKQMTESRAARAGLFFFAIALVGWIVTEYVIRRVRRHKWDRYFSEKIDASETFLNRKS